MFVRLKCSSPNGCLPETISTGIREVKKKFGIPNFLLPLFEDKKMLLSFKLSSAFFYPSLRSMAPAQIHRVLTTRFRPNGSRNTK